MDTFYQRFSNKIKGCISGFDRIVFKGGIRPMMYAVGAQKFFQSRGVLDKNFKPWVLEQSAAIVSAAGAYAQKTCGRGIVPIPSCHERKEAIAHERQRARPIAPALTPRRVIPSCASNTHGASICIFTTITPTMAS